MFFVLETLNMEGNEKAVKCRLVVLIGRIPYAGLPDTFQSVK